MIIRGISTLFNVNDYDVYKKKRWHVLLSGGSSILICVCVYHVRLDITVAARFSM